MPNKRGKLPKNYKTASPLVLRMAVVDEEAVRDDDSIALILATENPVRVYDYETDKVVDEVLRIDPMEVPDRVPMIDSHDRGSVRSVIGSMRDFEKVDGELRCRAYFGSDPESQRIAGLYREGHLDGFSVGASALQVDRDSDGNREITRSQLIEGSAVVVGADPAAVSMAVRAYLDPQGLETEQMANKVHEAAFRKLVERGLPEDATPEQIAEFEVQTETTATHAEAETVDVEITSTPTVDVQQSDTTEAAEGDTAVSEENQVAAAAVAAERSRIKEIEDVCREAGVADDVRRSFVDDENMTGDKAARAILARNAAETTGEESITRGVDIRGGKAEIEKVYDAARDAVIGRALDGFNPAQAIERAESARHGGRGACDGARERQAINRLQSLKADQERGDKVDSRFRYASLPDIARMLLERSGRRVEGLPTHEVCRLAMQMPVIERSEGAYHTTGSFANLLMDASNKTLLAAYDEAPATYPMWVRTAPSAPDFKTLNRIRFGELSDPEAIAEGNPYPVKSATDSKESYGVEKHGEVFPITLEAIVNDDMNAMVRIPQMQGAAMRRKINRVVYSVLTANAALSDGIALFHATSHGANLDATALSETALDTGFSVMSQQTGLNSDTTLGIRPSYLIVPSGLSATAHRLVTGGVVPEAVGNVPLYGANRPRPLMVVEEGQLDSSSSTAWYLAASSSTVDTVELTFLQGEEAPVLEQETGFSNDTLQFKIRQTFAAKAIDYRGLYQGNS